MSLRSPTTCSYISDATSFAMRHCTIAANPLPMYSEPDSFRSRHFIINQHTSGLGNEKKSPCRLWLIDRFSSLFNVKPSTVPTKPIHELYAHTRTTHPERFLDEERARRPNSLRHLRPPRTAWTPIADLPSCFLGKSSLPCLACVALGIVILQRPT